MFLLGLIALVTFIFARPLDFVPALKGLPLLYVFFFLAVVGFVADIGRGRIRMIKTPHLGWALFFLVWCLLTLGLWDVGAVFSAGMRLFICIALFYLVGHGVQSGRAFETIAITLLACSVWVSIVCTHMTLNQTQCTPSRIEAGSSYEGVLEEGESDGRACEVDADCYEGLEDPWSIRFRCEFVGLLGLTSIQKRVRYVGVLHDPNETAMCVCLGIPLALALRRSHKSVFTTLLVAITVIFAGITVVHSQSRGAQLVFMTVFGVFFLKRYGFKGLVVLAVAALPVLMLGGRSSDQAEGSSMERLGCQLAGIEMLKMSPITGVGYTRFTEYHHLTAHNSFVLAPAELGVVGMLAWSMSMYLGWRVPFSALNWTKHYDTDPGRDGLAPERIEAWALSLLAVQAGLAVGVFFLSFNYHYVLWVHLALTAAFYVVLRRTEPDYDLKIKPIEVAGVFFGHLALLTLLRIVIRMKLGV